MARLPIPRGLEDSPALRVANRLHSASIHLLRSVRSVDRESGVSPERLSLLSVLVFGGPKTVSELADLELVSPPAVSRILNGLEADGLVARERMQADRRYVRVVASAKGKRLLEAARARRLERIAGRLAGLNREELRTLEAAATILEAVEWT